MNVEKRETYIQSHLKINCRLNGVSLVSSYQTLPTNLKHLLMGIHDLFSVIFAARIRSLSPQILTRMLVLILNRNFVIEMRK